MTDTLDLLHAALSDRYAIERELGAGGMATVYLAEDVKHHRKVAIKVLRPELAAVLGTERFLREIEISANLNHPHILPLFDSGEADGFLYYVMPLVEGESLRDRLHNAKQLPIDETIEIATAVAGALDYAHRHDVVHRDVKPENILLHDGNAMVADFGIGKAVTAAAEGAEALTQTGMTLGTPAYMSPEQAAGEGEVDGRSDLYSLGCVLYEMLTGEQPFTGATAQAVIAKRFSMTPPEVTATRSAVPAHLSQIVSRLLERTPADRCATASQVVNLLKSGASASPQTAPAADKSIAVLPFANLSADPENEYFSDGITDEIITALTRLDDLHVASRTSSFSFKNTTDDLRTVGTKLKVRHILEGSVRRAENRVRISVQLVDVDQDASEWSERFDREMDDIFAVQDEIAVTIAERLHASLGGAEPAGLVPAATANIEAYEHYLRGLHLWHERGPGLFRAIEHFERSVELDPAFAAPYAGLADTYGILGLYSLCSQSEARERARSAAARALALAADDAESLFAAALVDMYYDWDLRRAESRFREALAASPRHARAQAWLAQLYGFLGRATEALEAARRARELDPHSSLIAAVAASGPCLAGDYEGASPFAEAALALDPVTPLGLWVQGWIEVGLDKFDDGVISFERAAELAPNLATSCMLCWGYGLADRLEEARKVAAQIEKTPVGHRNRWWLAFAHLGLDEEDASVDALCISLRERDTLAWAAPLLPFRRIVNVGLLNPRVKAEMKTAGLDWVVADRLRVAETSQE